MQDSLLGFKTKSLIDNLYLINLQLPTTFSLSFLLYCQNLPQHMDDKEDKLGPNFELGLKKKHVINLMFLHGLIRRVFIHLSVTGADLLGLIEVREKSVSEK